MDGYLDNLRATFSVIDPQTLAQLGEEIARARRVFIIGFRHGFYLAGYFCWSLAHARPDVWLLPRGGETLGESLVDAGAGDVVVAFAFRRRVASLGRVLDAVREAQVEEMERDADVLLMGQDMRASLYGSNGLVDLFGEERVLDLPTSETASVGTGVGAAMTGLRPVVDMTFACFTFVAMDQFISQVAKARYVSGGALRLPVPYRVLFI